MIDQPDHTQRVVDAAIALASTLGADDNHTVAAAVMAVDGTLYTGVNVYHFTGGPCAEPVALGAAAGKPLLYAAAAGCWNRGVIPPCGRCRQIMIDHHRDLLVAVPAPGGHTFVPLRDLLPHTYFSPDARAHRLLRFAAQYYGPIIAGEKTSTVRWNDPIDVGPATFVFENHPDFAHVEGEVLSVEPETVQALTPEYLAVMRGHYPTLPDDAELKRVTFRVSGR